MSHFKVDKYGTNVIIDYNSKPIPGEYRVLWLKINGIEFDPAESGKLSDACDQPQNKSD